MKHSELTVARPLLAALGPGDEIVTSLTRLAVERDVRSASFTGIGVVSDAEIGYLNPARNDYDLFTIDEPAEVVSLSGSIVRNHDAPEVHAHIVVSMADSSARGGHLVAAHVHPTLEVFLDVFDTPVHRAPHAATGQELISL